MNTTDEPTPSAAAFSEVCKERDALRALVGELVAVLDKAKRHMAATLYVSESEREVDAALANAATVLNPPKEGTS